MRKHLLIFFLIVGSSLFTLCEGQYTVLHNFRNVDGSSPQSGVVISGNTLYGVTSSGGANMEGCIYAYNTSSNVYTDLFDFNGSNGANPCGSLIISGDTLYGMASKGGLHNDGCIFSFQTVGNVYTDLFDFSGTNGASPFGSLTLYSGNILLGMTSGGGAHGYGCIFSLYINPRSYTDMHDFNGTDGGSPYGSLVLSGSTLYGLSYGGGSFNQGCLFSFNASFIYTDLLDFNGTNGSYPCGSLILSGSTLYGMTEFGGVNNKGCIFSFNTSGNTYTDLYNFNGTNGEGPLGSLILSGSTLYGVTFIGGTYGDGCVFSLNTYGNSYTDLYDFSGVTIGAFPRYESLVLSGNLLYGTTSEAGAKDSGVIFSFKDTIGHLGINNLTTTSASINVYPNPGNGQFTIQTKSEELKANNTVEIYKVHGEKVYSQFNNQQTTFTIDLSNQPNGVYLYRVISEDGNLFGEGKLIIQK